MKRREKKREKKRERESQEGRVQTSRTGKEGGGGGGRWSICGVVVISMYIPFSINTF